MLTQDTIVSLATAVGRGAISIIRVSGTLAKGIGKRVFGGSLEVRNRLILGKMYDAKGYAIDQGMAVFMQAPHSYTCEDVLELHCHGSVYIVRSMIDSCIAAGARPAMPGEFTKRAYLNGRLDLAQAQGVMDLIASTSQAAAKMSLSRLEGGLSRKIHGLEDRLLDLTAELTAYLDYPEEDLEELTAESISKGILPIQQELQNAIAQSNVGRLLREGVQTVIVGAPNAGKSSLLNALIDRNRAIVTDIPGTTRDTLTESLEIEGVTFVLTDTAGLHEHTDPIESIGIERAKAAIEQADVLLLCVDGSEAFPETLRHFLTDPRVLLVLNKEDLQTSTDFLSDDFADVPMVRISTKTGHGMEVLRKQMLVSSLVSGSSEPLLTHATDVHAARSTCEALQRAQMALEVLSLDCAALDLSLALEALAAVTGTHDDALADRIFQNFCLGK